MTLWSKCVAQKQKPEAAVERESSWKDFLHLSSAERWAAVAPMFDAIRTAESPPSPGMNFEDWKEMYTKNWIGHMRENKQNQAVMRLEMESVYTHSEATISLTRGLCVAPGAYFKRGTKGNQLNTACLELLPAGLSDALRALIDKHDVVLCHLQGTVLTLQPDVFRYVKS